MTKKKKITLGFLSPRPTLVGPGNFSTRRHYGASPSVKAKYKDYKIHRFKINTLIIHLSIGIEPRAVEG